MNKFQDAIIVILLVSILWLLQKKSTYQIVIPNEHAIGTVDDAIQLVGGKPVSPLLNESVVYEFLDTLARIKGANDASELLFTEFDGKSVQEVSAMLANVNVEQLISTLTAIEPADLNDIDLFEQELILNASGDKSNTGIDCTLCKWKQPTTTSGIKQCVYEGDGYEMDCNPGTCKPLNGKDPWPNTDPWEPSEELKASWACGDGKVSSSKGRCLTYSNDDSTNCLEFEHTYVDYTPVLNN